MSNTNRPNFAAMTNHQIDTYTTAADAARIPARAGFEAIATEWRWQNDAGEVTLGKATDARGLVLRASCGYTHVWMGPDFGWLQIQVAIRKVRCAERFAAVLGIAS